ncbi:hypothetical protein [Halegenticoccus tardaugens]|uniref:hypothetical protein n=1 Tax=Halegenticoccus tardaugens TaxID=2071624 RepID=UPI00100BF939|nr:hypothetical protein [Halegenticoccus tardaugens]
MALSNPSTVVSFDAEAALAAIAETVDGSLWALVEYDAESFNPLYVDDAALALYDDEAQMSAHFERIHSYVYLDFSEMELFADFFPVAERVEYMVTGMDAFTLVRVYVADREGLFMTLDPAEPVRPVVEAVRESVDGSR